MISFVSPKSDLCVVCVSAASYIIYLYSGPSRNQPYLYITTLYILCVLLWCIIIQTAFCIFMLELFCVLLHNIYQSIYSYHNLTAPFSRPAISIASKWPGDMKLPLLWLYKGTLVPTNVPLCVGASYDGRVQYKLHVLSYIRNYLL